MGHKIAVFVEQFGDLALAVFVSFEVVNLGYFSGRFSKKIINVPKQALFLTQMPLNTLFQIVLG